MALSSSQGYRGAAFWMLLWKYTHYSRKCWYTRYPPYYWVTAREKKKKKKENLNSLCTIEREHFMPCGSWRLACSPSATVSPFSWLIFHPLSNLSDCGVFGKVPGSVETSSADVVEAKVVFFVPGVGDVTGSLAVPPCRVALLRHTYLTRSRPPQTSSDITHRCGVGMSSPHWPETL